MAPQSMDPFRKALEMQANGVQAAIPERLSHITNLLEANFSVESASILSKHFSETVSTEEASVNQKVCGLLSIVREELVFAIDAHQKLERWIQLLVPKIEDGNNFGVEVQRAVIVQISQSKSALQQSFDQLTEYHWQRATAYDKLCKKISEERVTTRSTERSKDSEKAEEKLKDMTTEVSKDSITRSTLVQDFLSYIVAVDVKWYFDLRTILRSIQDHYMFTIDIIEKNITKIKAPRGHQGGALPAGMY